ncbi:MAG: hypothetical protein R3F61_27455 [Myxococcota bacterium]
MAFTVTFPTSGPVPGPEQVADWLRERGEPFGSPQPTCLQLRALDLRIDISPDHGQMKVMLEVSSTMNLSRVVDLVFELSILAGADVRLTGVGEVNRGALWMRLADEQDRVRIAEALQRAEIHGNREDVGKRLWQVVAAIRPGRDDRWDATHERIVELKEVGAPDGISLADASWHTDNPEPGDVIAVGVEGSVHTLAWRWLSEAYPGLAEPDYTFH